MSVSCFPTPTNDPPQTEYQGEDPAVSLVIPGRNVAHVVTHCLDAVVPLLGREVSEIIFVDDGSTDETAQVVADYPVHYIRGSGQGPGAARNLGWRAATGDVIWFIDSDCVAQPDAPSILIAALREPIVGGAGGSYGNMRPDSLLACLIHEEIIQRHGRMSDRVNFLATFNVMYRRSVLEEVGGFDEQLKLAQDAELAFRVRRWGHELRFRLDSRVKHFHPTSWRGYLRTQLRHGYYRVLLYLRHPGRMAGDSYSGSVDHVQPPLAMLMLASLPLVGWAATCIVPLALAAALVLTTVPMTAALVGHTRRKDFLAFAPLSFLRAIARGIGMTAGVATTSLHALRKKPQRTASAIPQRTLERT